AVIVDSPSRGRISGASVAAPVASDILAEGLRHTGGIDTDVRVATLPDSPVRGPDVAEATTIPGTSVRIVPDLRDKTLRDAVVALQGAQLDWTYRGSGRVVHQIPEPGTALVGGDPITLVLQ
ncbi:MAG: PASTA domain-containing protein, partial [Myxococcota bacterium]